MAERTLGEQRGHEVTDVHEGTIVATAVAVVVTIVVSLVVVYGLIVWWAPDEPRLAGSRAKLGEVQDLPPSPHLQPGLQDDLAALRTREHTILTSYGWVDKQAQVVRVPIERAMERIADQGLPSWGSASKASNRQSGGQP